MPDVAPFLPWPPKHHSVFGTMPLPSVDFDVCSVERVIDACSVYIEYYGSHGPHDAVGYARGCSENIYDEAEATNDDTAMMFACMCEAYIVGYLRAKAGQL